MASEDDSDGSPGGSGEEDERPSSKVARLIEVYGLGEGYGRDLETLWTADGEERESLRALADRFNTDLLDSALREGGASTLDGEIDNLYRLLTDEDVSSGDRTDARTYLERNGVDVEQLESDFVTYQAIRTYLTAYRGAEYESADPENRVGSVIETVQRLQSRVHTVVRKSLSELRTTGRLSIGEFRLFVQVNVLCEDCDTQYGVLELLRRGRCKCDAE